MSQPSRSLVFLLLTCVVFSGSSAISAQNSVAGEPAPIRIWKGAAPNSDPTHWPTPDYHEEWQKPGEILVGVTDPTIQVYLPEASVNMGVGVVICPGGGYQSIWIDREGWKVARELQKRGIAAVVLKYRYYDRFAAIQDAHRAVRYVRAHAREWRLKENAIGIGGFSAGGHLALNMAAQLNRPETWTPDEIDKFSKRPDFVMAIYPSVSLYDGGVVDASFPPSFFASASNDDKMFPDDIFRFYSQLRTLKVPAEVHFYQAGGHGFGTGTPECNCSSWLDLFRNWLNVQKLITEALQKGDPSKSGVGLSSSSRSVNQSRSDRIAKRWGQGYSLTRKA